MPEGAEGVEITIKVSQERYERFKMLCEQYATTPEACLMATVEYWCEKA